MVAALRMPHSGLIHALCCAEARSRVSLSSSSGHQKDRIKKYILSQQEAKLVNIAMTSSPHGAGLAYPPASYTVVKKTCKRMDGEE